jgi:hypothetical protein
MSFGGRTVVCVLLLFFLCGEGWCFGDGDGAAGCGEGFFWGVGWRTLFVGIMTIMAGGWILVFFGFLFSAFLTMRTLDEGKHLLRKAVKVLAEILGCYQRM